MAQLIPEDLLAAITALHDSPWCGGIAVTGGGSALIPWLLGVPGASRTVTEAVVPYSAGALQDLLGVPPEHFCDADTARQMAYRMRQRSLHLLAEDIAAGTVDAGHVIGLGATASLVSDRPKRGEHRCHVAAAAANRILTSTLVFEKETRTREAEESVAARLALRLLLQTVSLPGGCELALRDNEAVITSTTEIGDLLDALLTGAVSRVCVDSDGNISETLPSLVGVLPGSFNPLHEGHLRLRDVAAEILGGPVVFELAVCNVDKPPLERGEVERRLRQFRGYASMVLTAAPRFVRKAQLLPTSAFVIGYDTAVRVIDPRYYDADPDVMRRALAEIRRCGSRFLVAGRASGNRFLTCRDLNLPADPADLFTEIPEELFRADISSTEIRAAQDGPPDP